MAVLSARALRRFNQTNQLPGVNRTTIIERAALRVVDHVGLGPLLVALPDAARALRGNGTGGSHL